MSAVRRANVRNVTSSYVPTRQDMLDVEHAYALTMNDPAPMRLATAVLDAAFAGTTDITPTRNAANTRVNPVTNNLATDAQKAYAVKLSNERGIPVPPADVLNTITKRDMSAVIRKLLSMPRPTVPATAPAIIEPVKAELPAPVLAEVGYGMFRMDGEVYGTRKGRQSNKFYAVRWNGSDFEYAPSVYPRLTDAMRLTVEEVEAYSREIHRCGVCGRRIRNAESIKAMVGPICRSKI